MYHHLKFLIYCSFIHKLNTDDECAVSLFDCLLKENPCLKSSDNKDKTVIQKAIAILCGKRDENLRIGYQYYASISGSRFKTVSSHVKKLLDAGLTLDLNDLNDALLMCAKKSDFKGMECFLLNGGDCCKTDENGKSILHLCWSDCKYFTHFLRYVKLINK